MLPATTVASGITLSSALLHSFSAMQRPDDAKNWQPDSSGQDAINRMANFLVVAERCSAHLRLYNQSTIKPLWDEVRAEFQGDPAKYPVFLANDNDMEGKKHFQMKCEALCFSEEPKIPKELVIIFTVLTTSLTWFPVT